MRLPWGREAEHLRVGRRGEAAARRVLKRSGMRILARNLETPAGEADIVCEDRRTGTIVLVEVKTRVHRAGAPQVSALAAVDHKKRVRLVRTAEAIGRIDRFRGRPVRIDVLTVETIAGSRSPPTIRHFPGAVRADGSLA